LARARDTTLFCWNRRILRDSPRQKIWLGVKIEMPLVGVKHLDQVMDAAAIHDQVAIHEGFRRIELGIDQDLQRSRGRREADRGFGAGFRASEFTSDALGIDHGQTALPDGLVEQSVQRKHGLSVLAGEVST
jgi:hypothetical protein